MKEFELNGLDIEFWFEGKTLFCKVIEMGAEIYCCGNKQMPTTNEEAMELAENVWLW